MDKIYRLKKRMVYPEMLNLDQVSRKVSANSNASWISDEIMDTDINETEMTFVNTANGNANTHVESVCTNTDSSASSSAQSSHRTGYDGNKSASSENSTISMGPNREFIQDRIRHLVDAFTYRAEEAREGLHLPQTPSSKSSHELLDPPPVKFQPVVIVNPEEKPLTDESANATKRKRSALAYIRNIYDTRVIDPQGNVYVVWISVAALAVLYNAWVIPLRSTFPFQNANNRVYWMICDYTADFIYLIDIVIVQPRIMFLSEGFWMKEMVFTKQNYLRNVKFKLDILSLLPLDILFLYYGPEKVILRVPRFFKVHTFWDFFNLVDKLIASPHIIRIARTLLYMMYLIHLNACAYYAFSYWEGIGTNNFVFSGKGNAYIKCLHFGTKTATSIGKNPKPTQNIELIFMTFSWLMGVFVFALLIGQIRDIIATATRSQTEYRKLVDETLEYMRRLNLPQDMQRRVQLWFNYTWETQHTLDESNIMDCLPHKMKTDIAINVHIEILGKVQLFADCDEALLRELVLQLKSVIYLPGDIICKKGDVGKEMYIIQTGRVQVIGKDENEVLATLIEGSVFGEISLLGIGMNRRTADVRSQGYSNLFVLNKRALNAAISHYPEAQDLLNKKAKSLIKKNDDLERKRRALIVINNPTPPRPQAKLLDAVLQVVPKDSKANKLLRYGSRAGRSRPPSNNDETRRSLPSVRDIDRWGNGVGQINDNDDSDSSFQAKVIVHRTMS